MATPHGSRRGSLQFWPRVRAKRIYPQISFWTKDQLSGILGYKAGMVQYSAIETRKNINQGKEIVKAATVLEVPPVYVVSIVFYKNNKKVGEIFDIKAVPKELKKDLKRKMSFKSESGGKAPGGFDKIAVKVSTFPRKIGLKKTPEIMELGCGMDFEKAKEFLGKEINVSDYFAEGDYIDVTSISKGKGTQGVIKRFGVKLRNHHSKKGRRRVGSIGPTTPRKVSWRVPMPGQMGFNQRTEYRKLILKISEKIEEVNPKEGFRGYGFVRNKFILVEGSVPGSNKRLVVLRKPKKQKKEALVVSEIIK